MKTTFVLICLVAWAACGADGTVACGGDATRGGVNPPLWVYLSTNFLVDKNVEDAIALMKRAKAAGYSAVMTGDGKFSRWDDLPDRYLNNVARFREEARALGLECWAMVCPVGYSNDLLYRDPNLAEGLPVSNAVFVVRNGKFVPEGDGVSVLKNGSFEHTDGFERAGPAGWSFADEPGKISFLDNGGLMMKRNAAAEGYQNARAMQKLSLAPFSYWRVSVRVKTDDFDAVGNIRINPIGANGQSLNWENTRIKRTQDWTEVNAVFNTLENSEVNLYVGVWGIEDGKIWWDDVRVEPAGFVNIIRRSGTPVSVVRKESLEPLEEGRDFEMIIDPLMGSVPYGGIYTSWHKPPEIGIPEGSRLKEGDRVLASYYHATIIYDGQVGMCFAEPKARELLKWQIEQVRKNFQPDGYMLQHDEIRQCGWDASCVATGKSPGEMLSENVRFCIDAVRAEDPGKPIAAWSDMFDPYHNAKPDGWYYLVRGKGPWSGSWQGLDSGVTIVNWNSNAKMRGDSLAHFKGHPQVLAGYYDPPSWGWYPKVLAAWMEDAAREPRALAAMMYTTWKRDYSRLEDFAEVVGKAGGSD